jgi:hypothetical protein
MNTNTAKQQQQTAAIARVSSEEQVQVYSNQQKNTLSL